MAHGGQEALGHVGLAAWRGPAKSARRSLHRLCRQSQGGIGSASCHRPICADRAFFSASSYNTRSAGDCSLAYFRCHQANPQ
jgi:hypothetical protein